jgi:hypothetical protein
MERPRQGQRITSAESHQYLDREDFYFFSGPKGSRNHKGCTRHDNGLMIEAWEVSADFDKRGDAARKAKE